MPNSAKFREALATLGPIGEAAVKIIENQAQTIRDDFGAREVAERQVRDMRLELDRLKRQIAELRSNPR
jgi:hypothetical protein